MVRLGMFADAERRRQTITAVAAALIIAFTLPYIFDGIDFLGHNIPSYLRVNRVTDYLKGCYAALFFFIIISLLPVNAVDKKNLLVVWFLKSVVALGLMLIYEANYELDAYWYFEQSQGRTIDLTHVGIGNGTANMAAIFWAFENFVLRTQSFHALKVVCSFMSFSGLYLFYRGLKKSYAELPDYFFVILSLFPSILFWSTTLGKDGLMVFGICVSLYAMLYFKETKNPIYVPVFVMGLFLVAVIRTWLVPIVLVSFLIGAVAKFKNILLRSFFLFLLLGGVYYGGQKLAASFAFENVEQVAKSVGSVARSWQRGGSAGDVPIITTPGEALQFLPIGMFTALFRPLPGEVMNPFGLMAGIESLLMLILFWRAIRGWNRTTIKDPLVIWTGSYILLWSMLYAFLSPQNLGAAVRFRVQVLPVMIFFFMYTGFFRNRKPASQVQAYNSMLTANPGGA